MKKVAVLPMFYITWVISSIILTVLGVLWFYDTFSLEYINDYVMKIMLPSILISYGISALLAFYVMLPYPPEEEEKNKKEKDKEK